ncbi:hypothetical protein B7494_g7316 [Chlorociboria aeruginascens]|nr:hypothetical protein B7494_g7316 [Chlorociboria aeruginascens]
MSTFGTKFCKLGQLDDYRFSSIDDAYRSLEGFVMAEELEFLVACIASSTFKIRKIQKSATREACKGKFGVENGDKLMRETLFTPKMRQYPFDNRSLISNYIPIASSNSG